MPIEIKKNVIKISIDPVNIMSDVKSHMCPVVMISDGRGTPFFSLAYFI
jgi:hypothetical protein